MLFWDLKCIFLNLYILPVAVVFRRSLCAAAERGENEDVGYEVLESAEQDEAVLKHQLVSFACNVSAF
ncbi:unnamed protein product [Gongylonema pulchrum]|uniref:Secreted protein n=1 Tax=Gongylonema pulchrum TaxID=637853 RepID=A0A183EU57_9BILA|nr:unnamed protein product [Gongylonema pulchrum]